MNDASWNVVKPNLDFDLASPYGLDATAKESKLMEVLKQLTEWHYKNCVDYRNIITNMFPTKTYKSIQDVPYLPVNLFKTLDLVSLPRTEIVKVLTSSGTTGQTVSRIYLDRETASRQTSVLSSIMSNYLGKNRLPMVIVDSSDLLRDRGTFNARAAGILGFSIFGRNHHYCLDRNLVLNFDDLVEFVERNKGTPILLFGFTYIVWQALLQEVLRRGSKLNFGSGSILIHGGGWKRLVDKQVGNEMFKHQLREHLGIQSVYNYYGMVEQVGSVFMECEYGHLHSPVYADIIIRDSITLEVLPHGEIGVVQVLSSLPVSYPGHSLLTEDQGIIHGEDDCQCGRLGKYFSILGRLAQAEIRGCSDTRSV